MRKNKNGSLQTVAERVLTRRVSKAFLSEPEKLLTQLQAQVYSGKAENQTVTVAQAIVLALGRKALDGDKTAAEYLQRLADQAADEGNTEATRDLVIRVRMIGPESMII